MRSRYVVSTETHDPYCQPNGVQSVFVCQHDGKYAGCDGWITGIWRQHGIIHIVVSPFPKHLIVAVMKGAKVVFLIGVIVLGEIIELLHATQHCCDVIEALNTGCDHNATVLEGT